MIKFNEQTDAFFNLLNQQICEYHQRNSPFTLDEKDKPGEAEVTASTAFDCFHVRYIDKHSFSLLSNQKCADHLLFIYDDHAKRWGLHIFEFTKSMNNSRWENKVIPQFDGALSNAYAIAGVLHIDGFSSITVCCGYRIDTTRVSPAELKRPSGKRAVEDWKELPVKLPSYPNQTVHKSLVQLDPVTGKASLDPLSI